MNSANEKALFLGPQSENRKFFKDMLDWMIDDHLQWRKLFHPDDSLLITDSDVQKQDFQATLQQTKAALVELAGKLQRSSVPWFSPRYLGHMTADTLLAANLGYMLTLLYNPNNVAYEASPATTALEIEVGKQLATLLGYHPDRCWGHITSGGTVANYEGLWVARNLKSIPSAAKLVMPELVKGCDDWELKNFNTGKTLALIDQLKGTGKWEIILQQSVRGSGVKANDLGKVLVPQSKHYSWVKAADILGIGQQNLIDIKVKNNYRVDIDQLKKTIDELAKKRIPILALIGVVGSTEEGAVDEIHDIIKLRQQCEKQGIAFYLHLDAAFGGYARCLFIGENNRFLDFEHVRHALMSENISPSSSHWPSREVYEAYRAMPEADSITIDPHKLGYVPYATGAVVFQDKRILDLISYFASYVFEKDESNPLLLGSYILEGSKAGATVAATWMAHQVVPLNLTGYGKIIGAAIEGAQKFYLSLLSAPPLEFRDKNFIVYPLAAPDLNIVDFAFNEASNKSLAAMNSLNRKIYELCSYKAGPVYDSDFITSKTELRQQEYGDTPLSFLAKFDIPAQEWRHIKKVFVLRSCVMTPYLASNTTYEKYWFNFIRTMWKNLKKIYAETPVNDDVRKRTKEN